MRRALYREYRPRTLSEVIGQPQVTNALQKSLESGKTSHAYLFIGPRGTGKTSVARILAHEINGFTYELEDQHLDIIEIDAASNTGVDNIRSLRDNAVIAPTHGKYKIYIIDEVHMLTKSAFNALLKTLEEPPAHVIFIMATTDANKVPVTITSRSQTYTFKLASLDTIRSHLSAIAKAEKTAIADDALAIIARRGGGSFRDSISLLDQITTALSGENAITAEKVITALGLPSDELIEKLQAAFLAGDTAATKDHLGSLLESGIKPELIAEELIAQIVRDPQPTLLPLLKDLLEVPLSPRPDIKLLLSLLHTSGEASSGVDVRKSALNANSDITNSGSSTDDERKDAIAAKGSSAITARGSALYDNELPTSSSRPQNDEPSTAQVSSSVIAKLPVTTQFFSSAAAELPPWQSVLNTIKSSNPSLHSLLAKSTGELTGTTLKLSIKNKMFRQKAATKLSDIAAFLPKDTEIIITDQPLEDDPLLTNLNSIFGNVEEVELAHE